MYVCMFVCLFVCLFVCMYVYIYIYKMDIEMSKVLTHPGLVALQVTEDVGR